MTTVQTTDASAKTLATIQPPHGTTPLVVRLRAFHGYRSATFELRAIVERGETSVRLHDDEPSRAPGRPWRAWLEADGTDVRVVVADGELRKPRASHIVVWSLDTDDEPQNTAA